MTTFTQGATQSQAPAAPVVIEKAQRDTFSATLWVSGTVISQNDARIAAETDGRITWVADVGIVLNPDNGSTYNVRVMGLKGVYFLNIGFGGESISKKIVVE